MRLTSFQHKSHLDCVGWRSQDYKRWFGIINDYLRKIKNGKRRQNRTGCMTVHNFHFTDTHYMEDIYKNSNIRTQIHSLS